MGAMAILATSLLLGADAPKNDRTREELDKLKGTWGLVSSETDGNKASADEIKKIKLVFAGATLTVRQGDKSAESDVVLRPDKKPKQIDLIPGDGPDKAKTVPGIYELDDDNLKLCLSKPGKQRPAEFGTKADSGRVLIVLKRGK
jgi:uncharacterized protein (TIGR03067 family)